MASLIHEPERPRKPWRVDWVDEGRHRTRRFATKDERAIFVGKLAAGERVDEVLRLTVHDWLDRWMRTYGPAWEPVTRHERGDRIDKLIVPHLGRLRLQRLGRPRIRRWRSDLLSEGVTHYAIDRAVQVLSAACGKAVEEDLIRDNPCTAIGRLHKPVERRRAATVTEVEEIRAQMASARDRVMVSLMAYAGLRPSEMRALRWEDVGERTIAVRSAVGSSGREKRTKTGSQRSVPVIGVLADDLAALHVGAPQPSEGVVAPFHTDHRNWTTRVWRPARQRAGHPHVPPYALRHSFASLLIQAGHNEWEVAHLMGHSNPKMVIGTYGHLFADAKLGKRRPMQKVAAAARHAASISRASSEK